MNEMFLPADLFQSPIEHLELDNLRGMFIGLGSNENLAGFGVIIDVNLLNKTVHTQTNINSFDTIYLSNIRLNSDRVMELPIT